MTLPVPEAAEHTDAELWRRAADGGKADFGVLFQRHVQRLWNHAYRLTGSWAQAEDLTSATFLTAWRRRAEITLVRDSALPWLYTVMGNLARDERRGLLRRLRLVKKVSEPVAVADHADSVAARVDDEARARRAADAITALPPAQRRVVELCLVAGLAPAEAAEVTGIDQGTVRGHLSRARARLRQTLEESE
ncbi:RNA polymerase sigma factor [Herbihabitans rhizosphaerae]|uniref:RNA polymerase sigma factor n=1 Tax=Herbihabitans rhizosphaerae TaxID=1872711 RepID=UPI003BF85E50